MNELSITTQYPAEKYNLLGNTSVMVQVPDIMSPVIQSVQLDPNPDKGDVYIQQKSYTDRNGRVTPAKYAITKNGLKKLADGAGIKMLSSEHVIPTTCQKCVAVNQHSGKALMCGSCGNQDVAFKVTISVPQLTGEVLTVEDTHEIIVANVTADMSEKQLKEFMKHLPQICEAKALNGAIRTALHIKGTYSLEELKKPFVVAYLVPNMQHDEVKQAAIDSMFNASGKIFGNTPSIQQIEAKVPEMAAIEASDGENYDQYIDGTYQNAQEVVEEAEPVQAPVQPAPVQQAPTEPERGAEWQCDKCGASISQKVWDYSIDHYGRPLCYKCQKEERRTDS